MSYRLLGILSDTRSSFEEHVLQINSENVISVLNEYKQTYGDNKTSLLSAMCNEKKACSLLKHVINCVSENVKNDGVYTDDVKTKFKQATTEFFASFEDDTHKIDPSVFDETIDYLEIRLSWRGKISSSNGKIDENFSQGGVGDCWLLASIKSIASTPKGLEILNNSVKVNDDESTTVTLQGVNQSYTISPEELNGMCEYSSGDADVRALEIAAEKYMNEHYLEIDTQSVNTIRRGGWMGNAYKIFIGQDNISGFGPTEAELLDKSFKFSDELIEKIKDPNIVCTAFRTDPSLDWIEIKAPDTEEEIKIRCDHAYSVVRADDEFIYVVNPWDSGTEIKMTIEDFKVVFNHAALIEL